MKGLIAFAVFALSACATHAPSKTRTVVVLGNKTAASVCECPNAAAQQKRAEKWKAYAEALETKLGIPHEDEDKP